MKKRTFNRLLAFLGVLAIGAVFQLWIDRASAEKPSFSQIGAQIQMDVLQTGFRDTIYSRVPSGGSCVEASESRARTIAATLRRLRDEGKLGDLQAVVGTKSGYWVGVGSLHTYSVVEFRDRNGNYVRTMTVDNYLGGIPEVMRWWQTDWSDPYTSQIETVGSASDPARSAAQNTVRQGTRTPTGVRPPHAHTGGTPTPPPVHAHLHH